MNVINQDLSLNTNTFTIDGVVYMITSTSCGKDGLYNAIDTIKNTQTQRSQKYRRAQLNILLNKFDAKLVS